MIKVDMVLHGAITGVAKTLVSITISNTGAGTQNYGDYYYSIRGRKNQLLKEGIIDNWPRKRKTALALLQKVINTAYPK